MRDLLSIMHRAYVPKKGKIILEGDSSQLLNNNHIKGA